MMMQERLGDSRGFVHKKLFGLAKTALTVIPNPIQPLLAGSRIFQTVRKVASAVGKGRTLAASLRRRVSGPSTSRRPQPVPAAVLLPGGGPRLISRAPTFRPVKRQVTVRAPAGPIDLIALRARIAARQAREAAQGGPGPTPLGRGVVVRTSTGAQASRPSCPQGFFRDRSGQCREKRALVPDPLEPFIFPGGARPLPRPPKRETPMAVINGEFGAAEQGQFGAGLVPASGAVFTRKCPRGAVLGKDGLCYNKGAISNTQRMWPRGRRPLLTGGEMRCIGIANRAAGKVKRTEKRLVKMGMLPKRVTTRRAQPALPPGHHAHTAHD